MEINSLDFNGKELCWSINEEPYKKRFIGNIFLAEALCMNDCLMLVIVAREYIEGDDKFYLLDGKEAVVKEIFAPDDCPEVSSLYAVDKTTEGYDIIIRTNATSSGRDVALAFDSRKSEFTSWREVW